MLSHVDLQAAEAWRALGGWITEAQPTFGPGIKERFEAASRITDAQVSSAAFFLESLVEKRN